MQEELLINGTPSEMSLYATNPLARAVIISLFSWARANDDDEVVGGRREGFWGDSYEEEAGAVTGSRLWLLAREKITPEVLQKCKDYTSQALAWLVSDGVASDVQVTVERGDLDRVNLLVRVIRGAESLTLRFADVWKGLKNGF